MPSDDLQKYIDQGRGYEAEALGQQFAVYRQNEIVLPRIYVYLKGRLTTRGAFEGAISLRSIVLMEAVCDAQRLLAGDVLQGETAGDRYVIASKRPLQPVIVYRTDVPVSVRRPVQPTSAPAPETNIRPYSGRKKTTDQVLTYNSGTNQYSFAAAGAQAATVYAGKSQLNYTGAATPLKQPLDTRITRWAFVMEILPGVELRESDYLVMGDDFYQVYSVDKQVQGFQGQIVYADLVRP